MDNDPRYSPIDETLPALMPPISIKESERIAKLIMFEFGQAKDASAHRTASMYRRHWTVYTKNRRSWSSKVHTSGHHMGWGRLIHDMSHLVWRYRHPNLRPHEHGHAALELAIAQWCVQQGWLGIKPHMD